MRNSFHADLACAHYLGERAARIVGAHVQYKYKQTLSPYVLWKLPHMSRIHGRLLPRPAAATYVPLTFSRAGIAHCVCCTHTHTQKYNPAARANTSANGRPIFPEWSSFRKFATPSPFTHSRSAANLPPLRSVAKGTAGLSQSTCRPSCFAPMEKIETWCGFSTLSKKTPAPCFLQTKFVIKVLKSFKMYSIKLHYNII